MVGQLPQVRLRDVEESDLPVFFEHQRDPEATSMANVPARDREEFTAHWAKILPDETAATQTILLDGEVAGYVASWGDPSERLVGYWVGREHWGRGVATSALAQFLLQAPARPLYAYVAKHNIGSQKVLERCGFAEVAPDGRVQPDGDFELVMQLGAEG